MWLCRISRKKPTDNVLRTAVKFTQLNGSYDLPRCEIAGRLRSGQERRTTSLVAVAPATTDKSREYQIGVDVPLGSAADFVWRCCAQGNADAAGGGEVKEHGGIGLAAKYDLSKRTFCTPACSSPRTNCAGNAGETKTDVFAVGVQHKF